jgi:hypothetical protein
MLDDPDRNMKKKNPLRAAGETETTQEVYPRLA